MRNGFTVLENSTTSAKKWNSALLFAFRANESEISFCRGQSIIRFEYSVRFAFTYFSACCSYFWFPYWCPHSLDSQAGDKPEFVISSASPPTLKKPDRCRISFLLGTWNGWESLSSLQNRVLKSAVEEIVRQLSNSPQQTFTLAQVRQAYQWG